MFLQVVEQELFITVIGNGASSELRGIPIFGTTSGRQPGAIWHLSGSEESLHFDQRLIRYFWAEAERAAHRPRQEH